MTETQAELRQQAEDIVAARLVVTPAPGDADRILHELRVHQVELEMQNEELRRVALELEEANARIQEVYDMVPIGYFTVNHKGMISEVNLTGAAMLGIPRASILNHPMTQFITKESQYVYYNAREEMIQDMMPRTYQLQIVRANGKQFQAQVQVTAGQDRETGMPFLRLTLSEK
jgi:PAS domain S-box-containing protein